ADVDEYRGASTYLAQMDGTGEVILQTIALIASDLGPAKVSPKKASLPKTITPDRYRAYSGPAVERLEELGAYLTERLGVGLDVTHSRIPYDSIFPPMAIVRGK